jgi:hypothetical protein
MAWEEGSEGICHIVSKGNFNINQIFLETTDKNMPESQFACMRVNDTDRFV